MRLAIKGLCWIALMSDCSICRIMAVTCQTCQAVITRHLMRASLECQWEMMRIPGRAREVL